MSPRPTPAFPPSLADWEDHRAIIKRLYVDEDHSLSEVQKILCQKYRFRSSLRSYKTKLRSWGVRKYYSSSVTSKSRSPSILLDPGRPIVPASTSACVPGCVKDEDDDASADPWSRVNTPTTVTSETILRGSNKPNSRSQSPQNVGRALVKQQSPAQIDLFNIPDTVQDITESIILAAKIVADSSSQLGTPIPKTTDVSDHHTRPFRRQKYYIWHQFHRSLARLEQGHISNAFENLQQGCSMAEAYLLQPSRRILMSLLIVMGNRLWGRHQQTWLSVVHFMASMSSKVLGLRHPLTYILRHVTSWEQMRRVALPALRVVLDVNARQLGPAHPEVLVLKQSLSVELMRKGDFDSSEGLIQEASDLSSAIHGASSLARRNCLRRLGNLYMEQERWDEAEDVFETIIALDSQANLYQGPRDETSVFTCQNLSLLNYRRGNLVKSESWADRELEMALHIYGPEDEYYQDCLTRKTARLNGEPSERWFSWLEFS